MVATAYSDKTIASKPLLSQSNKSKTSLNGHSDEYYSFSDYASENSSNKSRVEYDTPPSRNTSPLPGKDESQMSLPQRPQAAAPAQLNVRFQENQIRRKPVNSTYCSPGDMSPPTPGVDDTPYIRFAIDQLTRDEEMFGPGRKQSITTPPAGIIPDEGLGYVGPPGPQTSITKPPQPPGRPSSRDSKPRSRKSDELFQAIPAPRGPRYPSPGFVPLVLRPLLLIPLILTILAILILLAFSSIHSLRSHGLLDYDGFGTSRYFTFQFLPQFIGIIVIIWLFVVQAAVYRTIPFFAMSARHSSERVLQDMYVIPKNFVLPDLSFFKLREPLVGTILLLFWFSYWTIPLLCCAYQTQLYQADGQGQWRWAAVQGVIWIIFVLYLLLLVALVLCAIRFAVRKSALLWDPVSIADLIPIFQKTNTLSDFHQTEISDSTRTRVPARNLRLGYWRTITTEPFHSVGEDGAPTRRQSHDGGYHNEKLVDEANYDTEAQRDSGAGSFRNHIHSPFIRYRWVPTFLRDSTIIAYVIIAVVLLIAFLVVSFVNNAVSRGFAPSLGSGTNSAGFSSSNFLYSFLPGLFGMILFLVWQPTDVYFRAVQPYANLGTPAGATAERTLLEAYNSHYPLQVTFMALMSRDFKVAYISFVNLMSATIPVLAGGVFTSLYYREDNTIRTTATLAAYYALCFFLAVYAFSYLVIFPKRKRYLPHSISTLADQMSFLYQSPLLTDSAFRNVYTKANLVGRLVQPQSTNYTTSLTEKDLASQSGADRRPKYAFGIYIGRDGKEHLGIDRLQRPGSGEMLVTTGMRRRGFT